MISALRATTAPFEATRIDGAGGVSPSAEAAAPGADFASVLAKVTTDAVGAVKGAEAASVAGIRGEASTQAVVDAVMGAERALQTAVVMRDKVVSAYQEISRMAI